MEKRWIFPKQTQTSRDFQQGLPHKKEKGKGVVVAVEEECAAAQEENDGYHIISSAPHLLHFVMFCKGNSKGRVCISLY